MRLESRSNTERGTPFHNGTSHDMGSLSTSRCNGWPIGGASPFPDSVRLSDTSYHHDHRSKEAPTEPFQTYAGGDYESTRTLPSSRDAPARNGNFDILWNSISE